MESGNREDLQRDEHGDAQNRIIPSVDPENESECSIRIENMGPACEERDQFFTASADSVSTIAAERFASSSEPGRPSPSSRIQEMIENKGGFSNEQEFEIHYSTAHWSELQPTESECSETLTDAKYLRERNRKSFYALEKSFYPYRHGDSYAAHAAWDDGYNPFLKRGESAFPTLGKKIAKGGQGEIFEAGPNHVVKLFDLKVSPEAVMTCGLLDHIHSFHLLKDIGSRVVIGRHLIRSSLVDDENSKVDGRFYIVMRRFWGDLRKLIDQRMMSSNNQGPPFTTKQVLWLMHAIAYDMWCLHKISILHRDLKASNVLVDGTESPSRDRCGNYGVTVADYECSDGVVGTGFWRAPEALQQLKDRKPGTHFVLKVTEECDVYSFGMTCYELVTGLIPFEGYPQSNYDLVLSGTRPELPADVDPFVKGIITRCWHPDPSQRPRFLDICSWVANLQVGKYMSGHNQMVVEGAWRTSTLYRNDASQMMLNFVDMCSRFANLPVGRFIVGAKLWPERFSERSGVVIPKYWGDLRMLIDKLTRRHCTDRKVDRYLVFDPGVGFPALNTKQDLRIMHGIARAMCNLHNEEPPIVHGHLEASNVLVYGNRSCPSLDEGGNYMVTVADYKCITGNRMDSSNFENWLAPEIIQQIDNTKNNNHWDLDPDVVVTKECDVYGYGMTCYELVTGRTPFDDEFDLYRALMQFPLWEPYARLELRKLILKGSRPKVPADLNPLVEAIITSCWNHDPSQRPTFLGICNQIANSLDFQPSS